MDFRPIVTKTPQWYRYHQRNRTEQQHSSQHTEQPTPHHRTTIALPTQLISARHPCSTHPHRSSRRSSRHSTIAAQHRSTIAAQHRSSIAALHRSSNPAQHRSTSAAQQHTSTVPVIAAPSSQRSISLQHNVVALCTHIIYHRITVAAPSHIAARIQFYFSTSLKFGSPEETTGQ